MHTHAQTHQLKIWSTHILDIHTIERPLTVFSIQLTVAVMLKVKKNDFATLFLLLLHYNTSSEPVSRCFCAWRHTGMIHWDIHWSRANTNDSLVKPVFFLSWRIITSTMILPLHWAVMTTGLLNDQLSCTHLVTTTYSLRLVSPGWKSFLLATMWQRLQPRNKLKKKKKHCSCPRNGNYRELTNNT